ncbi:DBF4-type zinc finger-containing protein 2 isoform X2 [Nerophis lumbriciformis]|uniref:DBF4-type zinc finger-containing protein 2 isoform X2 n=1 Tax=Nerophis lumbriciformis TaxID=546530 RepID=UPI002ADF71E0|nr:DBF4-type zinc finger-containing protein 2 isoform X2 [Nerophis lumbriciformis]
MYRVFVAQLRVNERLCNSPFGLLVVADHCASSRRRRRTGNRQRAAENGVVLSESKTRMWAESQQGPSRCPPCKRGYCTYCQVLYSDLDQHLSSLRHLDCVGASSRASRSISFSDSRSGNETLLERFLQDVLLHHPHCYNDTRPSDADLPSVSSPLLPREVLDEVCLSDNDSWMLGTRDHLPSSDNVSDHMTNPEEDSGPGSQLEKRRHRHSSPAEEQNYAMSVTSGHTHLSKHQAKPPVHRKAHRKTDRRKNPSPKGADAGTRSLSVPVPQHWQSWQKQQLAANIVPPHTDLDQTIEEVIQTYCHGDSLITCPQEETESFHISPPQSLQTHSDWDSPVQMQSHVQTQLDSVLHSEQRVAQVFCGVPEEETIPQHFPESFRGKTWTQIEAEDKKKVDELVLQFRQGRFVCCFDSESLARFGTGSKHRSRRGQTEAASDIVFLPLLNTHEEEVRKRRCFRMASRCQVVKVSHSTQTIHFVVPTVNQPATQATPKSVPLLGTERTPEVQCKRLPPSYSPIITPLQASTSLVHLLCSPTFPAPLYTSAAGSAPKRSRRRQRPLDFQSSNVKYKPFPVCFYDHRSNRIIKNPPKGFVGTKSSPLSGPLPSCVRQLFRSLSPDLNAERLSGDVDSSRAKSHRLLDTTSSISGHVAMSMLSTDSAQTLKRETVRRRAVAATLLPPGRSKRERMAMEQRPRLPKKSIRIQNRTRGLHHMSSTQPHLRRGRSQRGRGCDKTAK